MRLKAVKAEEKTILTLEGPITYKRRIFRPADRHSATILRHLPGNSKEQKTVIPMDEQLGVDQLPFRITPNAMLKIAYMGASCGSYKEASGQLDQLSGLEVSSETIRRVTDYVGNLVYEIECERTRMCVRKYTAGTLLQDKVTQDGTLYLELDGSAINTRHKDENGSSWRENKLGMAFSSDNIRQWTGKNGEKQRRIDKREYVSPIGKADDFAEHFLRLAVDNGYGKYRQTVIISDGAAWIRKLKEMYFPDAQQILDIFHLFENVWAYAKVIYKKEEGHAVQFANDLCTRLSDGKYQDVLVELKKFRRRKIPAGIVNLPNYIADNIEHIDYPTYRKNGWFIGSGAIESGNKSVVQRRLKLAGMRWNVPTAQTLLVLRCKIESGLWDCDVASVVLNMVGRAEAGRGKLG